MGIQPIISRIVKYIFFVNNVLTYLFLACIHSVFLGFVCLGYLCREQGPKGGKGTLEPWSPEIFVMARTKMLIPAKWSPGVK